MVSVTLHYRHSGISFGIHIIGIAMGLTSIFDIELATMNDSSNLSTPESAEKTGSKSAENGPEEWKQMMLTAINLKEKSEQEKQVCSLLF